MKIGLYFGSFNPVHIGHTAIANYVLESTDVEQVWFIISPQNPFKNKASLLPDYHRYELVNRAIGDYSGFRASNIEFYLSQPSYTIDTLTILKEKYPDNDFSIIVGSDILPTFHKWKNYTEIPNIAHLIIYPRNTTKVECNLLPEKYTILHNAPQFEMSSSFIRKCIQEEKDVCFFMPKDAYNYLKEMHFYEKHRSK